MAIEKKWSAIAPRAFTASGTARGVITLSTAANFRVKMQVSVSHPTLPTLALEVKRIISQTQLVVGPKGNIREVQNLADYDTQSTISAQEQERPAIALQEAEKATFEEEPVVARRTFSVDQFGNPYTTNNPLPVALTDANVTIQNAEFEVRLSHQEPNPDSVQIGDGTHIWDINSSGEGRVIDENTQAKLQDISDKVATDASVTTVANHLVSVISQVDDLENIVATSSTNTQTKLQDISDKVATEATLTILGDRLSTMIGHVDGLENLLSIIGSNTDQLEGFTDQIESLLTSIVNNGDQLELYTDQVETLLSQIKDALQNNTAPQTAGLNATLNLTTTAIEAKAGATTKNDRRYIEIQALSKNVKWGYDSSCPFDIFKNQFFSLPAGPNTKIYVKVSTGTGQIVVGEK